MTSPAPAGLFFGEEESASLREGVAEGADFRFLESPGESLGPFLPRDSGRPSMSASWPKAGLSTALPARPGLTQTGLPLRPLGH
jgi:hypothetical protein